MKLKVELDFRSATRAATKAGEDIGGVFTSAMKSSLASSAFWGQALRANEAKVLKFQLDMARSQAALDARELAKKHKAESTSIAELNRHRTTLAAKQAAHQAETDAARKAALQEEIQSTEKLVDLYEEVNNVAVDFEANTQRAVRALLHGAKDTEKLAKRMEAASNSAKEIQEALDGLSVQNLGENLTDVADKFGDALKNGIDLESLSKDLGKGIGKWVGKGLQAASGGGGAGAMGVGVTAAVGAIAAAVAAFGIFAALLLATDKKIKEFNKDIIKTHGALSVMRLGGGRLNVGLKILRHTVMDLQGNFGITEDEAKSLFDTLDRGGLTLSRLTGGVHNANEQQYRLNQVIRTTASVANVTGVSLSEYAEHLGDYVSDLAMSTETVNDNFLSIAKMANDSAFSTRRFYSMVVQATQGQSSLNVSMSQTGDLLMRMSKIMGMKKAAEMVGGATSDMAAMSAGDRIKANLVAGSAGRQVWEREAHTQSRNFGQSRGANPDTIAVIRSVNSGIADAVANAATDPDELSRQLGDLNTESQQTLIAGIRASGSTPEEKLANSETARQLDALIQVNRAATGSLGDRVAAMGQMSAGGSLSFRAAQMSRFMDPQGHVGAVDRAAAETVSGMSGQAMDDFLADIQANSGDFRALVNLSQISNLNRTAEQRQQLKNLEDLHHVTANNGVIQERSADGTGRILTDGNQLLQTTAEATAAETANLRSEAETMAKETMDATLSIGEILENKIGVFLQRMMEYFQGPFDTVLNSINDFVSLGDSDRATERQVREKNLVTIDAKLAKLRDTKSRRQEMSRLRVTAHSTDPHVTSAQRAAAQASLDLLTQEDANSRAAIEELSRIRSSIQEGNTYYTREVGDAHGSGRARMEELTGGGRTRELSQSTLTQSFGTPMSGGTAMSGGTGAPNAAPGAHPLDAPYQPVILGPPTVTPAVTPTVTPAVTPAAHPATAPAPSAAVIPPAVHAVVAAHAARAAVRTQTRAAPATTSQQARDPGAAATNHVAGETRQRANRERQERHRTERTQQRNSDRLIKGRELGNGLAESRLPDAIAEADAKMRLTEALFKEGKSASDVTRIITGGHEQVGDDVGLESGNLVKAMGLRRATVREPAQQDFIYQNQGARTVITPISSQDSMVGAKPGGALANLAGRAGGGGGTVNIAINGGDERRIFEVVKRAIQQAGITPNRVPAGGT